MRTGDHFGLLRVAVAREAFLDRPDRTVKQPYSMDFRSQLQKRAVAVMQFALAVAAHRGRVDPFHRHVLNPEVHNLLFEKLEDAIAAL